MGQETIKISAKLWEVSHLETCLPNEARWGGLLDMVERYASLEKCVRRIRELGNYIPTPS